MKVILTFTYGVSLKDWFDSGILDREIKIYKNLAKKNNIKFILFTYGNERDQDYLKNDNEFSVYPLYKYFKKSKFKIINFLNSILFTFKFKKELSYQNVKLIKTNQLNGLWVAIFLKMTLRVPLLLRSGYNKLEFMIKESKSILKIIAFYILIQLGLLFSNKVVLTSKKDKQFFEKYFLIHKKIEIIPNWVEISYINKYENRPQNSFISVGRLERQKNFAELIKKVNQKDINFKIVGDGSEKYNLIDLSSKSDTNFQLIGKVKHHELLNIYQDSRFFVLSSKYEGNPKVLLEAMANGCVVITNDIKSTKEIIIDQINGYVLDFENDDLNEKLKLIKNNHEVNQNIIKESINHIELNNSLEVIEQSELRIYKDIIKI